MVRNEETVYIIQHGSEDAGDDDWVSPEPVERVVTSALVDSTALSADDVDSLASYVDAESIRAVVVDGEQAEVTFTVEGHSVTLSQDGTASIG